MTLTGAKTLKVGDKVLDRGASKTVWTVICADQFKNHKRFERVTI